METNVFTACKRPLEKNTRPPHTTTTATTRRAVTAGAALAVVLPFAAAPTASAEKHTLWWSYSADRTDAQPLAHATLRADTPIHIFAQGNHTWKQVLFTTEHFTHRENKAPWDFNGGSAQSATGYHFSNGQHTVTAHISRAGKTSTTVAAHFTVTNDVPPTDAATSAQALPAPAAPASASAAPLATDVLRVSTHADRSHSQPLAGAHLNTSGPLYIFATGNTTWRTVRFNVADHTRLEQRSPWDAAGGTSSTAQHLTLRPGKHTAEITVTTVDGTKHTLTANFAVAQDVATTPTTPPVETAPATPPVATTPINRNDYPTVATTGVKPGVRLRPTGTVRVTTDGAIIENLDVSGNIVVAANNVTIRNVRVRTNTVSYGINVTKGHGGTLIENVEVQMGVKGRDGGAAIGGIGDNQGKFGTTPGSNVTVRRCHLHGLADGLKIVENSLYEHNYISVTKSASANAHVDGMQASGRSNAIVRHNAIDMAYKAGHNAAIFVQAFNGKVDKESRDIIITNNWLNGGVYTFHSEDGKKQRGYLKNIVVANNVFGRDYKYGVTHRESGVVGNSGVWADTGQKLP